MLEVTPSCTGGEAYINNSKYHHVQQRPIFNGATPNVNSNRLKANTSQQKTARPHESTTLSRLKYSAITRFPSAKSRLRQPVATSTPDGQELSCEGVKSQTDASTPNPLARPSIATRTSQLASKNHQVAKAAVDSTKSSAPSRIVAPRVSASLLPNLKLTKDVVATTSADRTIAPFQPPACKVQVQAAEALKRELKNATDKLPPSRKPNLINSSVNRSLYGSTSASGRLSSSSDESLAHSSKVLPTVNPIAVVHPQSCQQRNNSSAPAVSGGKQLLSEETQTSITRTTTIKFKTTKKTASSGTAIAVTTAATTAANLGGNGKANLKHKDVNGSARDATGGSSVLRQHAYEQEDAREEEDVEFQEGSAQEKASRESKQQDGPRSRIVASHVKRRPKLTNSVSGLTRAPVPTSRQRTSVSSCRTTTDVGASTTYKRHNKTNGKNDQIVPGSANNFDQLLPVGLLSSDGEHSHGDENQHGNDKHPTKAPSKHLLGRMPKSARDNMIPLRQQQTQSLKQRSQQASNCFNGANLKLTKSSPAFNSTCNVSLSNRTSSNIKGSTNSDSSNIKVLHSSDAGGANARTFPKPMGQQVLSLMMLDAGLLPASVSQLQQSAPPKKSHVRIQSESPPSQSRRCQLYNAADLTDNDCTTMIDESGSAGVVTCSNTKHSFEHVGPEARRDALANRFDGDHSQSGSTILPIQRDQSPSNLAYRLSNNNDSFSQLQTQNMTYRKNNDYLTSISMPSSPRMGVRGRSNWRRADMKNCLTALADQFNRANARPREDPSFRSQSIGRYREDRHDASDGWLSPARFEMKFASTNQKSTTQADSAAGAGAHCDTQSDARSMTSSSCSSLHNHCPPMLTLTNQLNGLEFQELLRTNAGERNQRMNVQPSKDCLSSTQNGNDSSKQRERQGEGVRARLELGNCSHEQQQAPFTNDLLYYKQADEKRSLPQEIDHLEAVTACSNDSETLQQGIQTTKSDSLNQSDHVLHSDNDYQRRNRNYLNSQDNQHFASQPATGSLHELQLRRHHQGRSNSISGQEFHSDGRYQRLKHSLYTQQSPYVDGLSSQHYNGAMYAYNRTIHPAIVGSYQNQQLAGRSTSPLSLNCQLGTHHQDVAGQRERTIKYLNERQHRNQLHTSLECLNTVHSEYGQSMGAHNLQHQQPYIQNSQQQAQMMAQNQHYAASYVLAAPPANTVINQSGDQDLAAAAMGNHPPPQIQQQKSYHSMMPNNSQAINMSSQQAYHNQTQNLLNRAIAQVSQSPLRRLGLGTGAASSNGGGGLPTSILSHHMSAYGQSSNPIRAGHSSLSLASSTFLVEDKLQNDIKKLQSELKSEIEKNEALNSQLNINSSLMAAFEQSLTTLNTRLRQLTALNEKKDKEIDELRNQLRTASVVTSSEKGTSPVSELNSCNSNIHKSTLSAAAHANHQDGQMVGCDGSETTMDRQSEQNLIKMVEDLRKQLIEKDRLLTDTRLEALSAAHQLEQLESRLNGEHSILVNEEDLDEGVMVHNHSPSDSDAITDSTHFSEINSHQISIKSNNNSGTNNSRNNDDMITFTPTNCSNISSITTNNYNGSSSGSGGGGGGGDCSNNSNYGQNSAQFEDSSGQSSHQQDDHQSNHSSDYNGEERPDFEGQSRQKDQAELLRSSPREVGQFESSKGPDVMNELMGNLMVGN